MRRLALGMLVAVLVAASCHADAAYAQAQRPNIVFILADDLGIGDTGITNQNARAAQGLPSFATPNIDALAMSGMRYNNMYTGGPSCSVSRNVMLTGFNQLHTIFERENNFADLRGGQQDETWGQMLQETGYETGMFGKWHVGGLNSGGTAIRSQAALPTQKGFETAFGPLVRDHRVAYQWQSDGQGSMAKFTTPAEPTWTGSGAKVTFGDTLVANRASDFIRANAVAAQPFAAYVPFMAPHISLDQVPQDHPYTEANQPDLGWTKTHRDYAGMIWYLDKHVGQILAAIDDPNNDGDTSDSVANNTIVMFGSDNGPAPPGQANGYSPEFFNSNIDYYAFKSVSTDGGIRTPFIVRWPGQIAANSQNNQVASYADIMPTFAELSGGDAPLGIDGRSLASQWTGAPATDRPDSFSWAMTRELGPGNPAGWTVRVGDWKLSKLQPTSAIPGVTYRLFNLATDPGELINRQSARPDIRNALTAIGLAEGAENEPYRPSPDNAALQERVPTYFTQYKSWNPQENSTDFFAASNWSGGTQYDKDPQFWIYETPYPEANNWNTGPATNWLASVNNETGVAQQVTVDANSSVLALGIAGSSTMTLNVASAVRLTARNGVRISSGGVLRLQNGELNTVRELEIRAGGRLEGEGLVNGEQSVIAGIPEFAGLGLFEPKVINGGGVAITSDGDASLDAGRLLIQGDFQQSAAAQLQLDVYSPGVAGLNFDQLAVTGKAILGGALHISTPNPGSLVLGDSFPIVTATGGLTGAFESIFATPLSGNLGWAVQYTPTIVRLHVVEIPDGGTLDYLNRWRASFGNNAAADLDGDGDTDGDDLLTWQRGIVASYPVVAAVPEPAAGLLLMTALVAAAAVRRRVA